VLSAPEYSYVRARLYVLYALSAVLRRLVWDVSCADLGCGFLPTPHLFNGVCTTIYAYDVDGGSLKAYAGLSMGLNVVPVEADVESVEVFGDGGLGLVLALSVLEHLRSPAKVVRNVAKSMVRGGVFAVAVPEPVAVCRRAVVEDSIHVFVAGVEGWVKLIESAGFTYLPGVSRRVEREALRLELEALKNLRHYLTAGRRYSLGAVASGALGALRSLIVGKPLSQPCSRLLIFVRG